MPTPPLTIDWWSQVINSLFQLYFSFIFHQAFKRSLLVKITFWLCTKKGCQDKWNILDTAQTLPFVLFCKWFFFLFLFLFLLFVSVIRKQLTASGLSPVPKRSSELVSVLIRRGSQSLRTSRRCPVRQAERCRCPSARPWGLQLLARQEADPLAAHPSLLRKCGLGNKHQG